MRGDGDVMADIYRNPSLQLEELYTVDQFFDAYVSHLETAGPALSSQRGPPEHKLAPGAGKLEPPTSSDSSSNIPGRLAVPSGATGMSAYDQAFNASPPTSGIDSGLQPAVGPYGGGMAPVGPPERFETPGVGYGNVGIGGYRPAGYMDVEPEMGGGFAAAGGAGAPGGFAIGGAGGGQGFMPGYGSAGMGAGGIEIGGIQNQNQSPMGGVSLGGPLLAEQAQGGSEAMEEAQDAKGRRARHRTPRQQMLNKQAQQRYRERKKAKAAELEQEVEELSTRVDELKAEKAEKAALEERMLQMERSLLEKDAELQRLRAQVAAQGGCGGGGEAVACEAVLSEQAQEYIRVYKELEAFMLENKIDVDSLPDPNGDLDGHLVKRVWEHVEAVCKACTLATRHEGPDIWKMITAGVDRVQLEPASRETWLERARKINMSADQKKRALILREEQAKKLEATFVARQNLNLEAIALLLPANQGGHAPQTGGDKLGCFAFPSFLQRSSHRAKTSYVLDKLKANLRDEQKVFAEMEYLTFHRVLNPLQSAWFLTMSYPGHCDCLSLLNATNELCSMSCELPRDKDLGEEDSPGSDAASKNK